MAKIFHDEVLDTKANGSTGSKLAKLAEEALGDDKDSMVYLSINPMQGDKMIRSKVYDEYYFKNELKDLGDDFSQAMKEARSNFDSDVDAVRVRMSFTLKSEYEELQKKWSEKAKEAAEKEEAKKKAAAEKKAAAPKKTTKKKVVKSVPADEVKASA